MVPMRYDDLLDASAATVIHRLGQRVQIAWLALTRVNQDLFAPSADEVGVRPLEREIGGVLAEHDSDEWT